MSTTPHVNIIARTTGVGLDRDVELVRRTLESAGFTVTASHCRGISPLRRWLPGRPRFDANIFLERVFPRWLSSARVNILIPNQERFPRRHLSLLRDIDHVFCKTRHAGEIFRRHTPRVRHVGFTSTDLLDPGVPRQAGTVLHLAGASTLKGTSDVLALWEKHPEWPVLTLIQANSNAPATVPANVTLHRDYLPAEEIRRLMNLHPIHLCPSRAEGWGHYIAEAMACGALVITTDAPPMNELVGPDRGILVPWVRSEPRHLGTSFHVDPAALETAIEKAVAMPDDDREETARSAREWFSRTEREFASTLPKALRDALA